MSSKTWFSRLGAVRTPLRILYWAPLAIVLTVHGPASLQVVSGPSMQVALFVCPPTLNPEWSLSRDHAVVMRVVEKQEVHKEDIVTLKSPLDPTYMLIKRIVAEEGDVIRTLPPYPQKEVTVPKGHVWIEGDDPFNSDDSNLFGPVPRGLIESKLAFLVWPPSRFGPLNSPTHPGLGSGPTHRRAMEAFQRAQVRKERVKPARLIEIPESPSA